MKLQSLVVERREVEHVELDEFLVSGASPSLLGQVTVTLLQYIIGDLRGAGWTVKTIRENDLISDSDLLHIFRKVDIDNNHEITTAVMTNISTQVTNIDPLIFAGVEPGLSIPVPTVPDRHKDGKTCQNVNPSLLTP